MHNKDVSKPDSLIRYKVSFAICIILVFIISIDAGRTHLKANEAESNLQQCMLQNDKMQTQISEAITVSEKAYKNNVECVDSLNQCIKNVDACLSAYGTILEKCEK